eukprot:364455-Chlamydomonas_euryale.AAC.4
MQQQMNEHAYQAIQAQAGGMAPPVHAMGYRDAYDPGMAAQHAQHAGQQHPGELPAFRNVEPLSRDDRDAMRSGGAALEKMRMRQKGVAVVDNPIGALPGSPAYADEQARFQRDYAAVSYQERQKMQERQQVGVAARVRINGRRRGKGQSGCMRQARWWCCACDHHGGGGGQRRPDARPGRFGRTNATSTNDACTHAVCSNAACIHTTFCNARMQLHSTWRCMQPTGRICKRPPNPFQSPSVARPPPSPYPPLTTIHTSVCSNCTRQSARTCTTATVRAGSARTSSLRRTKRCSHPSAAMAAALRATRAHSERGPEEGKGVTGGDRRKARWTEREGGVSGLRGWAGVEGRQVHERSGSLKEQGGWERGAKMYNFVPWLQLIMQQRQHMACIIRTHFATRTLLAACSWRMGRGNGFLGGVKDQADEELTQDLMATAITTTTTTIMTTTTTATTWTVRCLRVGAVACTPAGIATPMLLHARPQALQHLDARLPPVASGRAASAGGQPQARPD